MRQALLTLMLLAGVAGAVPVWLPELNRTAQLTATGLHLTPGQPLSLAYPAEHGVDLGQGRRARFASLDQLKLEVLNASGTVLASRVLGGDTGTARLIGTVRGPCVVFGDRRSPAVCLTPDLKTTWATLGINPLLVTRGGGAAIESGPTPQDYTPNFSLIRTDLWKSTTSSPVTQTLLIQGDLTETDAEVGRTMFDVHGAVKVVQSLRELPGGRLLACLTVTMNGSFCNLTVLDADGRRVVTLDGHAAWRLPQVSRDGQLAYALGSTLHVWKLSTGQRVLAISDAAWSRAGRSPTQAFLTPDGARAVVVAGSAQVSPTTGGRAEVFVYALKTGRLQERFIVNAP